ncbi:hypothetical protein GCM10027445_34320 [Amycolatopsis endophytica]|uniref:Uncharacterized protein n=1 Tax=Amycolatopsis endophytica TaxID=860233 RepID=A0A853B0V5_9PSEU|nr:hypothetical protein [Amycolatopsis endophytica]NYI88495.1 hypothetical protein [Amycolatopsis endophytica]
MAVNVAIYLLVCVTPPVLFWLASKSPALAAALRRRRVPAPSAPPIERLAADLRRVHRSLADLAPDAPMVRRRATNQAYDALLAQACAALGLRHWLDELPEGVERDVERLRVEEALRRAGLTVP